MYLALTIGVILVLVYVEGIHVDVPIVSTKYRGFTAVYPIKLLYTSVIPVILASALLANAVFMGQMLWANYNPNNTNPAFNWIATFDPALKEEAKQPPQAASCTTSPPLEA